MRCVGYIDKNLFNIYKKNAIAERKLQTCNGKAIAKDLEITEMLRPIDWCMVKTLKA